MKEEKKKAIIRQKFRNATQFSNYSIFSELLLRSAFLVVLFIMFYIVIITFAESEDETLKCDHSNERYWTALPVVLLIMLYKVVLTFESEDVILKCDNSNESSWAVLSCGSVYYAKEGDSNFWIDREMNPQACPFKWKLLSSTFL